MFYLTQPSLYLRIHLPHITMPLPISRQNRTTPAVNWIWLLWFAITRIYSTSLGNSIPISLKPSHTSQHPPTLNATNSLSFIFPKPIHTAQHRQHHIATSTIAHQTKYTISAQPGEIKLSHVRGLYYILYIDMMLASKDCWRCVSSP